MLRLGVVVPNYFGWLKLCGGIMGSFLGVFPLENTSAINISQNQVLHSRTKHIEIRHS